MIRAAAEDIGEADPMSLVLANAAKDTYDFLGSPEGELALAQLTVHLATAPKSNAVYKAFGAARKAAICWRGAAGARSRPSTASSSRRPVSPTPPPFCMR